MPLFGDDGMACGSAASVRPTRQHQHDSTCIAPTESAAPYDAEALRLARGLAHDFNNLLAIITGNVQLAQMRATDARLARYLRDAEQACEMAAHMTHSVSSYARDRHIAPVTIDLAGFLSSRITIFEAVLAKRAALAVTVASDVPCICVDQSGLESAMINLLGNARDAMPSGGSVTIDVQCAAVGDGRAAVSIAVRDTGCGMTERIRARAFDPFFTTKPAGHGTGLGLASVQGFARQAGGRAEIDSMLGHGTTVRLVLPAAPEQRSSAS